MTALAQTTLAALENQAFSLMGRMHVILRRQNGRVTDIEYMRINPAYCRHLLDMAAAIPNEDLQLICEKLDQVYFGEEGLFVRAPTKPPLFDRLHAAPASASAPVPARMIPSAPEQADAPSMLPMPPQMSADATVDQSYIGRLR